MVGDLRNAREWLEGQRGCSKARGRYLHNLTTWPVIQFWAYVPFVEWALLAQVPLLDGIQKQLREAEVPGRACALALAGQLLAETLPHGP